MPKTPSQSPVLDRVHLLVDPIVADLGLDLYDLEFVGGILKVVVDTPPLGDGGVTLETIALITRLVSRELEHNDPMPGRYTLEVTSPGLERNLRTPRHFQRETGKVVALRLNQPLSGERRMQGLIISADETNVVVRITDDALTDVVVAYTLIDRARTVFQWGPTPKTTLKGTGRSKSKQSSDVPSNTEVTA
jgi:ribosome maturation factor RimP